MFYVGANRRALSISSVRASVEVGSRHLRPCLLAAQRSNADRERRCRSSCIYSLDILAWHSFSWAAEVRDEILACLDSKPNVSLPPEASNSKVTDKVSYCVGMSVNSDETESITFAVVSIYSLPYLSISHFLSQLSFLHFI